MQFLDDIRGIIRFDEIEKTIIVQPVIRLEIMQIERITSDEAKIRLDELLAMAILGNDVIIAKETRTEKMPLLPESIRLAAKEFCWLMMKSRLCAWNR